MESVSQIDPGSRKQHVMMTETQADMLTVSAQITEIMTADFVFVLFVVYIDLL